MNFEPSEEQVLLRDMVGRFLADRTDVAMIGHGPMPREDWRALGELGLFAFLLPERGGGMGGKPQDAMIVGEELGRALAITPLAESVLAAADLVARHGSAAQVECWLPAVLSGDAVLALATGDVTVRDGRIDGRCDHIRWAVEAAALVVVHDDSAWLVPAGTPGLDIAPIRLIDGSLAGNVLFNGCEAEAIVLPAGAAAASLAAAQLVYVAEMVGAMALLYEQTVDYARQRRQFGAAIGTFQIVQHKLARMFVALEQCRSLLLKAGLADRDDPGFERGILAAKAYVAAAAQHLAEEAVQLHGGMGVTDELAIGRGLRRVMLLARLFGSADAARARLAA